MLSNNQTTACSSSHDTIREHVEKMVHDTTFSCSAILKRFLLFVVNETLEGRSNQLKEYTIAVNVLEKPLDFKPQENGIVRIHAGRLRRAISQYYSRNGATQTLRISIPKGNYVPVFENAGELSPLLNQREFNSNNLVKLAGGRKMRIVVLPFRHCSTQKMADSLADGVGYQLTSALQKIKNFSVIAFQIIKNLSACTYDPADFCTKTGTQYFFTGGIEILNDRLRVSIELINAISFEQIWSEFFDRTISRSNIFDLEDEITKCALSGLHGWIDQETACHHPVPLLAVRKLGHGAGQQIS